jgi:hypothetical protein
MRATYPLRWPSIALAARGIAGTNATVARRAARDGVQLTRAVVSHIINGRSQPSADAAVWLYAFVQQSRKEG